jgi:hypothetical protein
MCTTGVLIVVISIVAAVYGCFASSKLKTAQVVSIRNVLKNRYFPKTSEGTVDKSNPRSLEPLIGYLERVIDRQINKARGILPFNSVIIAAFSIERSRLSGPQVFWHVDLIAMLWFVIALLAVSSFLCLRLFRVRWGTPEDYEFENEVDRTAEMIGERSKTIEWATILSEISLGVGAALIVVIEFFPRS